MAASATSTAPAVFRITPTRTGRATPRLNTMPASSRNPILRRGKTRRNSRNPILRRSRTCRRSSRTAPTRRTSFSRTVPTRRISCRRIATTTWGNCRTIVRTPGTITMATGAATIRASASAPGVAIGATMAALPVAAAAISVAGNPYYYSNGVYYAPQGGQYAVVPPPQGAVVATPPPSCSTVVCRLRERTRLRRRILCAGRERLQSQPAADWVVGHDIAERRGRPEYQGHDLLCLRRRVLPAILQRQQRDLRGRCKTGVT